MALNDQTDKMLEPKKDETFFDKYVAGEKTKGMFNPSARDVVDFGSDFIPGVSETKDIISLGTNVNKGEYKSAGIDLASLILGAVPVVGDLARKGFKTLTKNVGKSEDVVSKQADEVGESLQKVYGNIKPPKKTTKAYKLFKADKKGNLYPLFVKMQGNKPLELNKWTKAEAGEINPKTGKVKSSLGDLAYRPGFHGGDLPIATHIGGKKGKVTKPNYRKDNQVWAEVEFGDDIDWQSVANSRALKNKNGSINVKTAHITDQVPEGGVYRYKTNPNMTGNWLIGGELKINRILPDKEVKNINDRAGVADLPRLKDLQLAEGGTVMKKQMEMFDDGGLKDEGGMIDEVSGNDVPSGSTREEVRDDIPAQLSEGEFVFPADVVRFIGLEKLMTIRQEAKQGLKQMEAMGQMGNSDEATMRDDLPFDINDLDMEDELEYNRGGVVEAANGMYVQPNIPTANINTGMAQPQTGFAPSQYTTNPYSGNPQNMYNPQGTPYAPANYRDLLGASADGAPTTESVRYFNEATGQTRMIPHLVNADGSRGETLYPVPEGFVMQEEAPKEEAKKTAKVQSTQVQQQDDGGESEPMDTSTKDPTGISYNKSTLQSGELKSLFDKVGVFSGLSILNPSLNIARSVMGKGNVAAASNAALGGIIDGFRGGDVNYFGTNQRNTGLQSGTYNDNRSLNSLTGVEQKTLGSVGNAVFSSVIEPMLYDVKDGKNVARSDLDIRKEAVLAAERLNIRTTIPGTNIAARTETIMREVARKEAEKLLKQKEEQEQRAQVARAKERAELAAYEQSIKDKAITAAEDRRITQIQQESQDSDGGYDTGGGYSVSDSDFSGFYNQGGLAGKKKKKLKVKRMKRGGLASR